MIPSPGRVVEYTLTWQDAEQINRRRRDAQASVAAGTVGNSGYSLHVGNEVKAGDTYPLIITRVWSGEYAATETTNVNGQVLLDGNDTLWVNSVVYGEGERRFREFARV